MGLGNQEMSCGRYWGCVLRGERELAWRQGWGGCCGLKHEVGDVRQGRVRGREGAQGDAAHVLCGLASGLPAFSSQDPSLLNSYRGPQRKFVDMSSLC